MILITQDTKQKKERSENELWFIKTIFYLNLKKVIKILDIIS